MENGGWGTRLFVRGKYGGWGWIEGSVGVIRECRSIEMNEGMKSARERHMYLYVYVSRGGRDAGYPAAADR